MTKMSNLAEERIINLSEVVSWSTIDKIVTKNSSNFVFDTMKII